MAVITFLDDNSQSTNVISGNTSCDSVSMDQATKYPCNSLLDLPFEIRAQVWQTFRDNACRDKKWKTATATAQQCLALRLTCRQIEQEVKSIFVESLVTKRQHHQFMALSSTWIMKQQLQFLSIEIPIAQSFSLWNHLSFFLMDLRQSIHVLKLFGVGSDADGQETSSKAACPDSQKNPFHEKRLTVRGQSFDKRFQILNSIACMSKLDTLVLSNLNLPILQSHVLLKKPHLKRLKVTCDPKSALHLPYTGFNSGSLLSSKSYPTPPIEHLELCANAALSSLQIAAKVSTSLRSLTWTAPTRVRQAVHGLGLDHWYDSCHLLRALAKDAPNLSTLRMCIESAPERSDIGSFEYCAQEFFPQFKALKNLEFHFQAKDMFFGKEFLQNLPPSLEKLYISDSLVSIEDLTAFGFPSKLLKSRKGYYDTGDKTTNESMADIAHLWDGGMNLKFIGYQYKTDEMPEEGVQALLRLNGRLLERSRNQHLLPKSRLEDSWTKLDIGDKPLQTQRHSAHRHIDKAVRDGSQTESLRIAAQNAIGILLRDCYQWFYADRDPNHPLHGEFGNEHECFYDFFCEKPANANELVYPSYPVDVEVGTHSHFMCKTDGDGEEEQQTDGDLETNQRLIRHHDPECDSDVYFLVRPGRFELVENWLGDL